MYGTVVITVDGWTRGRFSPSTYNRRSNDSAGIYDLLAPLFGHEAAEDAASWCELAAFGDVYDGDGFSIELVEE